MIKIFKYLSNCKFSYQLPKRNKVLLYDSTMNSIRILNLLNITEFYKFNIRDEINIPILIFSILKNGFKNIFTNYKLAHIQFVNPKLVITWTDNDINFYKLKEYLKNICFIAIQNGYRTGDNRDLFFRLEEENYSPKDLRTDLIICFGNAVAKEYKKHINCSVLPLGSIRNNNINKVNFLKYNKELTYLSVFKTFAHKNSKVKKLNGKLYTQYRQYHKVDKIILNFLKDYCKENKYHLSIIARSFKNDQDIFYEKLKYKKILKNFDWTFIEKQTEDDAYEFIKNTKSYLVNQDCTLGYELLSKYYRVAFFSIRGNVINTHGFNFGWPFKLPDKGNFWTNYPSIKEFKEILNFVVNSSELEWKKEVDKIIEEIMIYDHSNSKLKLELDSLIKKL